MIILVNEGRLAYKVGGHLLTDIESGPDMLGTINLSPPYSQGVAKFDSEDCVVTWSGNEVTPESDMAAIPADIAAFAEVIYSHNNGEWADKWRALQNEVIEEVPEEPLSPEDLKATKTAEILKQFDADIAALKSGYTDNEVKSWDQKAKEAKTVLSGAQEPTPMLDRICADRGLDKTVYAQEIAQKAALYADQYGAAESRMKVALENL